MNNYYIRVNAKNSNDIENFFNSLNIDYTDSMTQFGPNGVFRVYHAIIENRDKVALRLKFKDVDVLLST